MYHGVGQVFTHFFQRLFLGGVTQHKQPAERLPIQHNRQIPPVNGTWRQLKFPFGCRIVGIPLSRLRSIALVGGSGLAALAGIMILPVTPMLYTSGLDLTLKGLIAASVVGLASPMRGLLMGIALGVGESLVATYGPSNFQEAIVYSILAAVLLARPQLVASAKLH